MTVLEAISKHMEDNNLDSANGINICQLIIDNDISVSQNVGELVDSYKRHKEESTTARVSEESPLEKLNPSQLTGLAKTISKLAKKQ